ncbi:hypothetical protein Bca101_018886 [Brassica carinata]
MFLSTSRSQKGIDLCEEASALYCLWEMTIAEKSGTITEVLAEDGKPASVDIYLSLSHPYW